MELIQLNTDQLKEQKRIWQAVADIDAHAESFLWQLKELARALPQLKNSGVRKGALGVLKGYFSDYRSANSGKYEKEINVLRPIDGKIPFEPKALSAYISFVGLWISGINFLKKEFGKKVAVDIGKFIIDLAAFYPEAARIFKQAQTSFERTGDGGLKFKILRFIDNNKNAAPSVHAEVAARTYSRLSDIIDAHAPDPSLYESIKNVYFQKAVKVLESLLLIKQHVVMDIGVAFAILSSHDVSFNGERARKITESMFKQDSHGMDEATVKEIHESILSTYNEVAAAISENKQAGVAEAVINFLINRT